MRGRGGLQLNGVSVHNFPGKPGEKAVTEEDERYLRAILDALRADDGKHLRALLKSLSKSDAQDAKDLAQVLTSHPSLHDLIPH